VKSKDGNNGDERNGDALFTNISSNSSDNPNGVNTNSISQFWHNFISLYRDPLPPSHIQKIKYYPIILTCLKNLHLLFSSAKPKESPSASSAITQFAL